MRTFSSSAHALLTREGARCGVLWRSVAALALAAVVAVLTATLVLALAPERGTRPPAVVQLRPEPRSEPGPPTDEQPATTTTTTTTTTPARAGGAPPTLVVPTPVELAPDSATPTPPPPAPAAVPEDGVDGGAGPDADHDEADDGHDDEPETDEPESDDDEVDDDEAGADRLDHEADEVPPEDDPDR